MHIFPKGTHPLCLAERGRATQRSQTPLLGSEVYWEQGLKTNSVSRFCPFHRLFSPLSRPPSPLSLPRPRSAPARRPPLSAGDISFPARPHTPLSRIDVRPPLDWGPQRQTLSRPPISRRGPSSEAGGGRPPRSPQPRTPEHRTQVHGGSRYPPIRVHHSLSRPVIESCLRGFMGNSQCNGPPTPAPRSKASDFMSHQVSGLFCFVCASCSCVLWVL